jgi:hypothetical protein
MQAGGGIIRVRVVLVKAVLVVGTATVLVVLAVRSVGTATALAKV